MCEEEDRKADGRLAGELAAWLALSDLLLLLLLRSTETFEQTAKSVFSHALTHSLTPSSSGLPPHPRRRPSVDCRHKLTSQLVICIYILYYIYMYMADPVHTSMYACKHAPSIHSGLARLSTLINDRHAFQFLPIAYQSSTGGRMFFFLSPLSSRSWENGRPRQPFRVAAAAAVE